MPIYSDLTYIGPANVRSRTATKYGIVFHNTSNSRLASASDEATYAKRRTDASAHYYVDKRGIVQSLNTDLGAGHAGSSWPNAHCIAYEITGWNSFSRDRWLSDVAWGPLVRQVRRDCERWGIPMRWLTVDQLRRGERGFATHDDCRRAFGGTSHTDPGPNFPKDHLLALLKEDDMDLNEKLGATRWTVDRWGDPRLDVEKALSHGYTYSRNASDNSAKLLAETRAVRSGQAAILAAVQGLDTDAILEAINTRAAEDAERDAVLLAELQDLADGGATAQQILDALAARITGQGQA